MSEDTWTKPAVTEGVTPTTGPTFWNPILSVIDRILHRTARNNAGFQLDADTVSGAGIGTAGVITASFLATFESGYIGQGTGITGGPAGIGSDLMVFSVKRSSAGGGGAYDGFALLDISSGVNYVGIRAHGSGAVEWVKSWDANSDGNGGQPPASKSNRTSNTTIGWIDAVDCASGGTVTLPTGGIFETKVMTYGATYNGVKCAIVAGGAMSGTASANLVMSYKRLS